MPTLAYYLATIADPMDSHHPLWRQPLPDNRVRGSSRPASAGPGIVTYGDYFYAVAYFCASNQWERPLNAASHLVGRRLDLTDLQHLAVFLEKHGAFYHPARLRITVADQTLSLLVNVAVSANGRQTLPREVAALAALNDRRPFGWLTEVYGSASVKLPGGDELPMFMGNWFEGFHEFHLTRRFGNGDPAVEVWNGRAETCLLSESQVRDLYRKAAMILTACYDPISTCQIFPWHHAAGDFVVSIVEDRVSVRLITVRDYAPMLALDEEPLSERALLEALLLFFMHLSIRMRLDRLDGVGPVTWAPDCCLEPVIDGFFQGLDLAARMSGFPASFPELFRSYVKRKGSADLAPLTHRLAAAVYDRRSEEHRVIESHLDRHLRTLYPLLVNEGL